MLLSLVDWMQANIRKFLAPINAVRPTNVLPGLIILEICSVISLLHNFAIRKEIPRNLYFKVIFIANICINFFVTKKSSFLRILFCEIFKSRRRIESQCRIIFDDNFIWIIFLPNGLVRSWIVPFKFFSNI